MTLITKIILSNVGYVTSMDAKKTNSLMLKQKSQIKLQYLTKKDSIGQKQEYEHHHLEIPEKKIRGRSLYIQTKTCSMAWIQKTNRVSQYFIFEQDLTCYMQKYSPSYEGANQHLTFKMKKIQLQMPNTSYKLNLVSWH